MATDEILIPQPRTFPRWLVLVVVAGILVAGGGAVYWQTVLHSSSTAQRYLTAPVQRTELADTIAATGPIAAARAVPLNFKNSGKVAEIDVKVGDTVKAGQVLARLDPTDFQAQLRQAQANLDAAGQKLAAMQAGPRPEAVAQAQAGLKGAQARLDAAQHPYTDADVAAARAALDHAQAGVTSAQAKLDAARAPYTQADMAAQQAAVDTASSNLKSAQAKLAQVKAGAAPAEIAAQQGAVAQAQSALVSAEDKLEQYRNGDSNTGYTSNSHAAQAVQAAQIAYNAAVAKLEAMQTPTASDLQAAQTTLDSAQNSYNSALAKLNQMKAGPLATDVRQAQSGLDQANAAVASARAKYDHLMAGPRDTDIAQAQSAVDQTGAQLAQAQNPHTQQDIDGQRAQVAAQQALVDLAQANLDAATLTAPSAGVVTALSGAVGQWLAGGSTSGAAASAASGANNSSSNSASTFISLTDLSNLQVQPQVNEADVGRLQPGQPVTFTADAFPGQTFKGSVAVVQPLGSTSQNVVTYPVLISIEPNQARLLPGMTASVTVTVNKRSNVLVVPSAAVSFAQAQATSGNQAGPAASGNAGPKVLAVDGAGNATLRPIQIGTSDGRSTEVVSDLEAGQLVAIGIQGN